MAPIDEAIKLGLQRRAWMDPDTDSFEFQDPDPPSIATPPDDRLASPDMRVMSAVDQALALGTISITQFKMRSDWGVDKRSAWDEQEVVVFAPPMFRGSRETPSGLVASAAIGRGFDAWPRILQATSLVVIFTVTLLAAAGVASAAFGLGFGFLGLSAFFFGNFAANRRGVPHWLVGPIVATVGAWGSLITAVAIAITTI